MILRTLAIVSILLFGCQTTGTVDPAKSMNETEIKELVAYLARSYTDGDIEGFLTLFHPDASIMHSGQKKIRSSVSEYREILPVKMEKYPGMETKVKRIKIKSDTARVFVHVKQGKYQWDQYFNLVKYEGQWKILNWDY